MVDEMIHDMAGPRLLSFYSKIGMTSSIKEGPKKMDSEMGFSRNGLKKSHPKSSKTI